MTRSTIEHGVEVFRFASFSEWVNTARSVFRFYGMTSGDVLCIDARGRICNVGAHFMAARDEEAFPIVVYRARP